MRVEVDRLGAARRLGYADRVGKLGHSPSMWFARYKTKLGITDPRKTFQSFRNTLIADLRDAGVQDSLIKRIAGHRRCNDLQYLRQSQPTRAPRTADGPEE